MDDQRFSMSTLALVGALMLLLGAIGGAVSGAYAGRKAAEDRPAVVVAGQSQPNVAAATPSPSPTATVVVTPSVRATGEVAATTTPAVPIVTQPPGTDDGALAAVADVVARVNSSVVTVINKQRFAGFFNDGVDLQPVGSGTGFVITQDGYIVTNDHVVEGSDSLDVIFENGDKVPAQLIGTDPFTDIAVIKIDAPVTAVVPLGDSTVLRPGEQVVAIGSALGSYTNTVTEGVVSGLGRRVTRDDGAAWENMIQHDAPINPGNSGGPLFNMRGEVVGVNTAGVRWADRGIPADGLGFAVASETVQKIVTLLIAEGKVERPYIGINSFPLSPLAAESLGLPMEYGVLITEIATGGPAANSGLQREDVITAINGEVIDRGHPFVNILFQYKPGDTVQFDIYRPATEETLSVQLILATRPDVP